MNVLFINQYFPPDEAPTGLMLERVAEEMVEQGHEVTILCAKGGYAKTEKSERSSEEKRYRIVRIGSTGFGRGTFIGKLADYAFFYLGVAWHLTFIKPKPDRIVALTTPPYLSILARFFSRMRGGDHAHWVMDLYPDVMVAHGMLSSKGLPARFLGVLARWGFGGGRSRMVLTLGPNMEARTTNYLSTDIPRQWVPLWGTAENATSSPPREKGKGDPLVLMYSGNMGLGHSFDEFLEVADVAGDAYLWKFHGQGKRRPEVEKFIEGNPEAPIRLGDYVPREELADHLAAADVHLASLDPVWDGCMVPSKLQGIFAIGRPVIFVGSETCDMGIWINESGGGWVVPPGGQEALKKVLDEALDADVRAEKGRKAREFSASFFDAGKNARKISKYLS